MTETVTITGDGLTVDRSEDPKRRRPSDTDRPGVDHARSPSGWTLDEMIGTSNPHVVGLGSADGDAVPGV